MYSNRPPTSEFRKQAFSQWRILAVETGERVRLLRTIYKDLIGVQESHAVRKYQNYESMILMRDLLQQPVNFLDHAERYSLSVIFSAVYGVRVTSLEHPAIKEIYAVVHMLAKCTYFLMFRRGLQRFLLI